MTPDNRVLIRSQEREGKGHHSQSRGMIMANIVNALEAMDAGKAYLSDRIALCGSLGRCSSHGLGDANVEFSRQDGLIFG